MMTMDTVSIVSDGFSTWLTFSRQPRLLTCFKHLSCCIWIIASDSDLKISLGLSGFQYDCFQDLYSHSSHDHKIAHNVWYVSFLTKKMLLPPALPIVGQENNIMSAACHLASCHPWEQRPDGSVITFVPFISRHQDTKITIIFVIITITTTITTIVVSIIVRPLTKLPTATTVWKVRLLQ